MKQGFIKENNYLDLLTLKFTTQIQYFSKHNLMYSSPSIYFKRIQNYLLEKLTLYL